MNPTVEVDLDKYLRNFRIFYSKIIGGHPQQLNLQKKFKFLLENQVNRWRSGLFANKPEQSDNSVKSYLTKAKSIQSKSDKKKKYEWLMQTNNFTRAFLFGSKSKQGITIIRQHLEHEDMFVQDKVFKGVTLRKITYAWSKIQKLFQNAFNAKPHSTIAQSLNQLPDEFIQQLYKIFTERRVKTILIGQVTEDKLKKLSDTLKINITYFELENSQVKLVRKGGEYKKNINIGFLLEQQIYVIAKQLPKKQRQQVQKQKTLIKMSQISHDLFRMYENTEIKLKNLDSILNKQKAVKASMLQTPPKLGNKLKKSNVTAYSSRF